MARSSVAHADANPSFDRSRLLVIVSASFHSSRRPIVSVSRPSLHLSIVSTVNATTTDRPTDRPTDRVE
jgi:hypothetical protein